MKRLHLKYLFPLAVLLVMGVLAATRISGSSIGMYNLWFYGDSFRDPNLVLGNPRPIRSDEWRVQTPWTIAEAQIHFDQNNTLYAAGQNLTTMNVPVANWVMAFKPWLWPFFVLPLENAFALSWWLRSAILLIVTYMVLLRLTKQDVFVSALGALTFLYSPYFQWWYGGLLDIASYGLLTFYVAMEIFRESSAVRIAVYTVLCAYFAVCFALLLYPPAQIPVVLCFLMVGAGALVADRARLNSRNILKPAAALAVAGVGAVAALALFYVDFRSIVTIIRHTAYPGQRLAVGGDMAPLQFVAGFLDVFLLHGQPPDILGQNQSEAASFFLLSAFLIPLFLFRMLRSGITRKTTDPLLLGAILFYFLMLFWMLLGLPGPLANVLLLQFVLAPRAWLAVGMINLFLIYYYLYRYELEITPDFRVFAWLDASALFFMVLYAGHALRIREPNFIPSELETAAIAVMSAALLLLLLFKQRRKFAVLLLLFTLVSTFTVNPFYRGLSPLLDSNLSAAIKKVNAQDHGKSVWVMYGSDYGNFLAANGVKTLGGTYAYPNLDFWRRFDPAGRYVKLYNRYSLVVFETSQSAGDVKFRLPAPDVVQITIDPCDARLADLEVNYFVFFEPVERSCLRQIDEVDAPALRAYIYQRTQ